MSVTIKPHTTSKREDTLDQRQEMFLRLDLLMKHYSQLKDSKSPGGFGANIDLTKNQVFTEESTSFEMSIYICAWVLTHLQHSIIPNSRTAWCQRSRMCHQSHFHPDETHQRGVHIKFVFKLMFTVNKHQFTQTQWNFTTFSSHNHAQQTPQNKSWCKCVPVRLHHV